ncbi:MAG TPA: DNA polymerase III subunit gamma/tau [Chthoniobacterales bacterium]
MSYEVFARKYRPQTFDDIVGQTHVTRTLKNAVEQNRLAHAYLFVGPRGIGKTSTARILAKALNCVKGPTITPCGVCDNCREITAGNSLDVLEIDGASNNGVEQVRELRDNVRYAPSTGRYKIYIIDEVHMLTPAAFNALLKTLEEPPPHVKFIFATTEPQKVLPTILSRCQRFDLHRIPANLIAQHLQFISGKEKITLEPAAAHAIARGAEGGLRDAESMLDQIVAFCGDPIGEADVLKVFGFTSEETVARFTDRILQGETADALKLLHEQCEEGKDMMKLMSDLIAYLRDLLVFKVKPEALSDDFNPNLQSSLQKQAKLIEMDRLLELIEQFAGAEGRMKWAPNKKLHFEVAVIKAIHTLGQATLDQVIENLAALRDGKEVSKKAVAGVADVGSAAVSDHGYNKSAARVAEKNEQSGSTMELDELWQKIAPKVPQKSFLRTLIDSVTVLGAEGRNFLVGYPLDQKSTIETLATAANKKQLETLLKESSGRDWTVKFLGKEGLVAKPASIQREMKSDLFKNDSLVQEALEIFKGEIKSVTT